MNEPQKMCIVCSIRPQIKNSRYCTHCCDEGIHSNCLDKQRVKEVIKACINADATPSYVSVAVYERILKELGL